MPRCHSPLAPARFALLAGLLSTACGYEPDPAVYPEDDHASVRDRAPAQGPSSLAAVATGCTGQDCVAAVADPKLELGAEVCQTLDFDLDDLGVPVLAGTVVEFEWAATGLEIECENADPSHPHACIAFDSSAPTGGDVDLGTPHGDFGGPGRGDGGARGAPFANARALGNLLVIAENAVDADGDGLVDDPDDEAGGGIMSLFFFPPARVEQIELVDIDHDECGGSLITCTTIDGAEGEVRIPIPTAGDNSVQTIEVGVAAVHTLDISLVSSGALGSVTFCSVPEPGCARFPCGDPTSP